MLPEMLPLVLSFYIIYKECSVSHLVYVKCQGQRPKAEERGSLRASWLPFPHCQALLQIYAGLHLLGTLQPSGGVEVEVEPVDAEEAKPCEGEGERENIWLYREGRERVHSLM